MSRRTSRHHKGFFAVSLLLLATAATAVAQQWPSFRGPNASGIADGQNPPVDWDATAGVNVLWRTAIPGLGHSSPAIWGNRLFVTTAVAPGKDPYLKVGMYGESPDNPEDWIHEYRVYCLDKRTGQILWSRTAHSGKPHVQRHIKSSHANPTPATDGERVVVSFGSEGLYAYSMDGELFWQKDFGVLESGAWNAPGIEWGFGSSPVIHDGKVIVLCDVNNQSFLTVLDAATGETLWRTDRDEVSTWGTPTVAEVALREVVVVNGFNRMGAYDLATGEPVWWLHGGGDVPVPTPLVAGGLAYITNAHGRLSPIYAVRLGARGDLTLPDGVTASEQVAWSNPVRGSYLPTPIVYGDVLYVGNDRGVLTTYDAKTGEQIYRVRFPGTRSITTASAVAADGRVYFLKENCETAVVAAGREYRTLATNPLDGVCLASPAISEGRFFIRTTTHVWALGTTDQRLVFEEPTAAAAEPAPAPASAAAPAPETVPAGELTDPVEILKRADAAARAVRSVRYEITVEETGTGDRRFGSLHAAVVAQGHGGSLPEKFAVEGEAQPVGAPQPSPFRAGSNGDVYWLVDPGTKTVHVDFEVRILGSWRGQVSAAFMPEFFVDDPFGEEIHADGVELLDSKDIGGEDCWTIRVVYSNERPYVATWYFAKKDFLPRARQDHFTTDQGQPAGFLRTLTHLVAEPEIDPAMFDPEVPEGYSQSDRNAP